MIKEFEINGIKYPVIDRSTLSFDDKGIEQGAEKETIYYWKKGYEPDCYYKADLNFFNNHMFEGCGDSKIAGQTDEDILMFALKDLKFWCEDAFETFSKEEFENEFVKCNQENIDGLKEIVNVCLTYIETLEFEIYKKEKILIQSNNMKFLNTNWIPKKLEVSQEDIDSLLPEQKKVFNFLLNNSLEMENNN